MHGTRLATTDEDKTGVLYVEILHKLATNRRKSPKSFSYRTCFITVANIFDRQINLQTSTESKGMVNL